MGSDNITKIIAIDGTSASGKGTLSKNLAKHIEFDYLDTGILYRTVGYAMQKHSVSMRDIDEIISLIKTIDFSTPSKDDLYGENIGSLASQVGEHREVRQLLNQVQRNYAEGHKGVVVDGRDMGTVVFPDADFKLYIDAKLETRANRRYKQLQTGKKEAIYSDVFRDLKERDERDMNREVAPLTLASDAVYIDTTDLDANEVLDLVLKLLTGITKIEN